MAGLREIGGKVSESEIVEAGAQGWQAAATVRLRVHQFAKLRGVCVKTVWVWIDSGKVVAKKDEGGHRWYVIVKNTPEGNEQERKLAEEST